MGHAIRLVLSIALLAAAGSAWGKPICLPTHPLTRAELYPEIDRYETMSMAKLEKLAGKGDPSAMNALGIRYGTGQKVKKDSQRSFEMYRRAAELGLPIGQANLAFMYDTGEGTAQDHVLAYSWALKAADAGESRGQMQLGYMLGTGRGVPIDLKEAAFCYLLAARQGNVEAQHTIANIYSQGYGIPENHQESLVWRRRAQDAAASRKPWIDETPLTDFPAEWTPRNELVEQVVANAQVRTPNYSFRVQAPSAALVEAKWLRYVGTRDNRSTSLIMQHDRDSYMLVIEPRGKLGDGEGVVIAAQRLRPESKYQAAFGRKDCIIALVPTNLGDGMASLGGFCVNPRDQEIFEIVAGLESQALAAKVGLDAGEPKELADQLKTVLSSFRFE